MLPRLQAELIVTAVITSAVSPITSIAIVGSFETPKSLLASLSDRLAVRQAVRAAAEQFVQSTATRLQAEAMSGI